MLIDPYRSKHTLAKELSDYQIQVLLLLQIGCRAVTSEGSTYKVWLENMRSEKIPFKLRKDTLNALYGVGLLTQQKDLKGRYNVFCYSHSQKALDVIRLIPKARHVRCFGVILKHKIDMGYLNTNDLRKGINQ